MILALGSVLLGAAMMWAFRRMANPEGIRRSVNRIQAHLLEFWLFVDEPTLIWKSWKGLLLANARLLRLMVLPLIALSIPMTPLFFFLDACYGTAPLLVNQPALVTLGINKPLDSFPALPALEALDGMSIEGPPVRIFSIRQISWRIRPARPLSGTLQWVFNGATVTKSVPAGGAGTVSRKRTGSLLELVRYPTEAPLPAGPIDWIEITYPPAAVTLIGIEAHWSAWFLLFSILGAFLAAPLARLLPTST